MTTSAEPRSAFPPGFLWGAATSSCQIEGSPLADGAGASNWHRFAHSPGRIRNGDTPDVACDHYRRWRDDVALMRALGLKAYRFSIAWARVMPEGRGRVNERGLAFYDRLVDALLEAGITPFVTLFHWDLPAALDDRGGWLNPEIARWFADYARVAFERLDDRVPWWATLNEPWVVMDGGYQFGVHAPGHASPFEAAIAAQHLLWAHGEAVRVYREIGRHAIGLVVNLEPKDPASDSEQDRAAAALSDAYMNRQFLDPVFFGAFPEELARMYGEAWRRPSDATLRAAAEPIDFLGVNYYTRGVMRAAPERKPLGFAKTPAPENNRTETGWEIDPKSFTRVLRWVRERYGELPILVTENGAAMPDPPRIDAPVLDDPRRVDYLRSHVAAVADAIASGVDLRGYFVWSLLDNFEWAEGFSKRFGIVHVDFDTQQRTLKRSAEWYRELIATNGAAIAGARASAAPR
ncbi:MAG TPA: GH1 family beta-glucosidase [Candidatus Eisenbacteria bacterium]|nr:GH1 family beta-glucosidase [Candidatus Eisenbacteria bacterium]